MAPSSCMSKFSSMFLTRLLYQWLCITFEDSLCSDRSDQSERANSGIKIGARGKHKTLSRSTPVSCLLYCPTKIPNISLWNVSFFVFPLLFNLVLKAKFVNVLRGSLLIGLKKCVSDDSFAILSWNSLWNQFEASYHACKLCCIDFQECWSLDPQSRTADK